MSCLSSLKSIAAEGFTMHSLKRSRTNDPEALKQRVVDAAFQAFTTKGFNATGIQDLIRSIGVSGGAYSHHFPSKKDLAMEVIATAVTEAVDKAWITPIKTADSTKQGVTVVFRKIIESLDRAGTISGCPLNNLALELSTQDSDLRAALNTVFLYWQEELRKKIQHDQACGMLKHLRANDAATFIIATYSGAMAMAKASRSTSPLRICSKQLASYLS